MSKDPQRITCFRTVGDTAAAAAAAAAGPSDSALTVVFATAGHDLAVLASDLAACGVKRVIGASTGRIISASGFEPAGVVGFQTMPV